MVPLGLERVTVDTPVYFSMDELIAEVENKNSEMVEGLKRTKTGRYVRSF